ncbi:MAG: RNA-directed DNA polymerase [Candidatus Dadabacteria bacterium]|nr:RNA-directed DNA polymerase [Candidatus Dadabacteria bacterium]
MESGKPAPRNFKLTADVVKQAYLYLKSYAYYENLNFFLKQKIAEFECDPEFDERISGLVRLLARGRIPQGRKFKGWLEDVSYRILPKSVRNPEDKNCNGEENELFISNVTTSSRYCADKVNYFIIAPVELHVIEVLWCLVVGPLMEEELRECCFGNRMDDVAKNFVRSPFNAGNSRSLFKYYMGQYGSWRDRALETAKEISESGEDVALLSLDLKFYYYNVDLNFEKIKERIEKGFRNDDRLCDIALALTDSLEKIFSAYHEKTIPLLSSTHPGCEGRTGLPVGFLSSSILANWYLAGFDGEMLETARPDYYGRYVDDILMIFRNPGAVRGEDALRSFVGKHLGGQLVEEDGGTGEDSSGSGYYVKVDGNRLPVQRDKLILHFLEKEHSRAGLEVFRQELQERSSAFRFLPDEEVDRELDRFAYDILYRGLRNKLRSVLGLAENETELSRYLSAHITLRRLCETDKKDSVLPQLKLFFKGKNALRFSRLWEKVYQYDVVVGDHEFIRAFYESVNSEIGRIEVPQASGGTDDDLTEELREDLETYNKISLGLCVALLDIDLFSGEGEENRPGGKDEQVLSGFVRKQGIGRMARYFRGSNLLRHSLVAWPMANFTGFRGNLTDEREFRNAHSDIEDPDLENRKIILSPRFIHFDEWQLFYLQEQLAEKIPLSTWQNRAKREYEDRFGIKIPVEFLRKRLTEKELNRRIAEALRNKDKKSSKDKNTDRMRNPISVGKKTKSSLKTKIALANIRVEESDIEKAIRKDSKPNISFERQGNLYDILNCAVREEADMLIMPELSIPVSWLPFMAAHSRTHQLAMIFGLEHWNVDGFVYNLLVELLPFKLSEKYNSCFMTARLKNHYAPDELRLIENLRLRPAGTLGNDKDYYNRINWNGITFASYNCFELSDIEHRTLFKSEIDVLFACVCNKDTNYYQDILGSAVRDLHCYVVQSNASQYGGSCVLRPMKTEDKTMLYVKGGQNPGVLITEIDVAALRDFQYKPDPGNKYGFKPLPPGFDFEKVLER